MLDQKLIIRPKAMTTSGNVISFLYNSLESHNNIRDCPRYKPRATKCYVHQILRVIPNKTNSIYRLMLLLFIRYHFLQQCNVNGI